MLEDAVSACPSSTKSAHVHETRSFGHFSRTSFAAGYSAPHCVILRSEASDALARILHPKADTVRTELRYNNISLLRAIWHGNCGCQRQSVGWCFAG